MTDKNDEALRMFGNLVEERGPTMREFGDAMGLASSSAAQYRLDALADMGLIEQHRPGMSRGWRLTLAGRQRLAQLHTPELNTRRT